MYFTACLLFRRVSVCLSACECCCRRRAESGLLLLFFGERWIRGSGRLDAELFEAVRTRKMLCSCLALLSLAFEAPRDEASAAVVAFRPENCLPNDKGVLLGAVDEGIGQHQPNCIGKRSRGVR